MSTLMNIPDGHARDQDVARLVRQERKSKWIGVEFIVDEHLKSIVDICSIP